MRKLLFVIAAAGLLVVVLAPIAAGDDNNRFKASLNGYYEVPSISTGARASFHTRLNSAVGVVVRICLRRQIGLDEIWRQARARP